MATETECAECAIPLVVTLEDVAEAVEAGTVFVCTDCALELGA